jgi:hypothetical protein
MTGIFIIYGATGYTGQLVSEQARQAGLGQRKRDRESSGTPSGSARGKCLNSFVPSLITISFSSLESEIQALKIF